jgi:acetyl esterase/lipase
MGITTIPLWDGAPPGSDGSSPAEIPTLTVFRPQPGKGNGTAVVVAPGGAYLHLASNLEGRQVADWLTARGITAFVLRYRLGPKNLYPIPLKDAQRAIRLVRSLAKQYGVSPERVGMMGFSAGGHLTAMTGTLFSEAGTSAANPIDGLSDRPDFLVLGYPWLNAMQPNKQGLITYCSLIKTVTPEQCKSFETEYTPSLHVTARTPPTFIYSTTDDKTVPVSASVDFYSALIAAGVSAELHIFRHGGHGSGLGAGQASLDQWPVLLEQWLRDQGLLDPVAAPTTTAKATAGAPAR